jgi:RNA polymerase-binding transcription factor DksA
MKGPENRLQAIPWAGYCVDCQEILDVESIFDDDVTIH